MNFKNPSLHTVSFLPSLLPATTKGEKTVHLLGCMFILPIGCMHMHILFLDTVATIFEEAAMSTCIEVGCRNHINFYIAGRSMVLPQLA
jgi:hypothetical protein